MATRTTKLGALRPVANTSTVLLTVPAGFTYLVKSVIVANTGAGPDTVTTFAQDSVPNIAYLITGQVVSAAGRAEWNGFLAMNPGDQLIVLDTAGLSYFWVSGTKLLGVA